MDFWLSEYGTWPPPVVMRCARELFNGAPVKIQMYALANIWYSIDCVSSGGHDIGRGSGGAGRVGR